VINDVAVPRQPVWLVLKRRAPFSEAESRLACAGDDAVIDLWSTTVSCMQSTMLKSSFYVS
jgi:hypothetical protein